MRAFVIVSLLLAAAMPAVAGDVSASYGGVATWIAPGLVDRRADVLGITVVTPDASWRFALADGEQLGDMDGAYIGSLAGFGYGRDYAGWGWYATVRAITHADATTRLATPAFGLRIGRFDRAAVVGEARFDDVFLVDLSRTAGPSVARDFDLRARGTAVVRPWLRLEARARLRDATMGSDRHVRDAMGALGVELAVAGKDGFRVTPLFAGIGARAVIADSAMPAGTWQLLAWLELDFSINSARTVW